MLTISWSALLNCHCFGKVYFCNIKVDQATIKTIFWDSEQS